MTHTDTGTTGVLGAKRASWKPANTRAIFEQLMREHSRADRNAITKLYRETIENDPDLLRTDLEYCCDNHWLAWERERKSGARRGHMPTGAVAAAAEEIRTLLLMSLIMPNGKQLGDCTGLELRRFGSWCLTLSKKVKPRQLVRDALTEDDLRAAWAKQ